MEVTVIGTESLGVRGLSCMVTGGSRHILIDPGVALGYLRNGHLPHPRQVAVGAAGDYFPLLPFPPAQGSNRNPSRTRSRKRMA